SAPLPGTRSFLRNGAPSPTEQSPVADWDREESRHPQSASRRATSAASNPSVQPDMCRNQRVLEIRSSGQKNPSSRWALATHEHQGERVEDRRTDQLEPTAA